MLAPSVQLACKQLRKPSVFCAYEPSCIFSRKLQGHTTSLNNVLTHPVPVGYCSGDQVLSLDDVDAVRVAIDIWTVYEDVRDGKLLDKPDLILGG